MIARDDKKEGTKTEAPDTGPSRWRGRLWRYGPLIVWTCVIFFGSTGSLSASNTSRIIRPLLTWLDPEITEAGLLRAHFLVRKAAHFTEYAVLALLAARAFLGSRRPGLRARWYVAALALAVACALLDEYHQSFVPSRTGSPYDSLIDAAGAAFAVLALALRRMRQRARV